MSHAFVPGMVGTSGYESTICVCGEPRHHHLPTSACQCGARTTLDPHISEWSCPTCGTRFTRTGQPA